MQLINQHENWSGEGNTEEERIIELFYRNNYDLVLLGGGISVASEKKIRALFGHQKAAIPIIQHYGGGSGLLANEIEEALEKRNKTGRIGILDNPFA